MSEANKATDIEALRVAFEPLSITLTEVAKAFGTPSRLGGVYVFHCPMAFDNRGADWLQNHRATENPYFGSAMFACGGEVDMLEPVESDAEPVPKLDKLDVPNPFRESLAGLYTSYFALQTALSRDDLATARTALTSMAQSQAEVADSSLTDSAKQAWTVWRDNLNKQVSVAAKAADIEGLRVAFEPLSITLTELAKALGTPSRLSGVYVFHCPMAFDNRGADWLQNHRATENPYFGSAMFACGGEVEILSPQGRDEQAQGDHDPNHGGGHEH